MDWDESDREYFESDVRGFTVWSTKMAEAFREFNRVMQSTSESFRRFLAAWNKPTPPVPYKRSKWHGYGRG